MKKKSWRREPSLSTKLIALKSKMEEEESDGETLPDYEEDAGLIKCGKKDNVLSCHLCFKVFGFRYNLQRHLASGKCSLLCDQGHDHNFIFRKFSDIQQAKDYITDDIDPSKDFIIRNSRPKSNYFVYVCSKRESESCFARFSLQQYKPKSKHTSSLKSIFVIKGCLSHSHTIVSKDDLTNNVDISCSGLEKSSSSPSLPSFQENVSQVIDNYKELMSIIELLSESPDNSALIEKLLIESSTNISKLLYNQLCS
ncbi:uncharacterized protein [Lepeophtheirus salmonis]|uniref:uncharacterized protein n=1 Tax=Lepeophtheirus salmonis TaxID=72036 RepID=UPI003AF3B755